MKIQEYFKIWWFNKNESPFIFYDILALLLILIIISFQLVKKKNAKQRSKQNQHLVQSKTELEIVKILRARTKEKAKIDEEKQLVEIKKETEKKAIEIKKEIQKSIPRETGIQKQPIDVDDKEIQKKEKEKSHVETIVPVKEKLNSNKDQVKIEAATIEINSIADPEKSEFKKIGYIPTIKFEQPTIYEYPVIKMPKANSSIKFSRKGRSEKKGFKEESFQISLEKQFSPEFKIYNNRHIPTKKGRPYEPDFVIENEKSNKNIFINIEIDEPYDGWTRMPTHCICEDDYRDDFFIKRGWIVIRFTEEQIHKDPISCCALISKVIKEIDKEYVSELLSYNSPNSQIQWNDSQSLIWEALKYREKYLGISDFQERTNSIIDYQIFDSENDKLIENEISESESLYVTKKTERPKEIMPNIEIKPSIDAKKDNLKQTITSKDIFKSDYVKSLKKEHHVIKFVPHETEMIVNSKNGIEYLKFKIFTNYQGASYLIVARKDMFKRMDNFKTVELANYPYEYCGDSFFLDKAGKSILVMRD